MKLIGTYPSPYVRRLRLLLENVDYSFETLSVYEPQVRAEFKVKNPTLKVPMLEDGDTVIFDSLVIGRYLIEKLGLAKLTWQQENTLTVINAINDSLAHLLVLGRSDLDTSEDRLFFNLQNERVKVGFKTLNDMTKNGEFDVAEGENWSFVQMCLLSLLDWAEFRELFDFSKLDSLIAFQTKYNQLDIAKNTHPQGVC